MYMILYAIYPQKGRVLTFAHNSDESEQGFAVFRQQNPFAIFCRKYYVVKRLYFAHAIKIIVCALNPAQYPFFESSCAWFGYSIELPSKPSCGILEKCPGRTLPFFSPVQMSEANDVRGNVVRGERRAKRMTCGAYMPYTYPVQPSHTCPGGARLSTTTYLKSFFMNL